MSDRTDLQTSSIVIPWATRNEGAVIDDAFAAGSSIWVLSAGKVSKFDVVSKEADEFDLAMAYDELGGGTKAREASTGSVCTVQDVAQEMERN